MDRNKLRVGHKYLRRRAATYGRRTVEAESWLECVRITPAGATFFGAAGIEELTEEQIREQIIREA